MKPFLPEVVPLTPELLKIQNVDAGTSTHPRGPRRIGLAKHLAVADAQCGVVLLVGAFHCHDLQSVDHYTLW